MILNSLTSFHISKEETVYIYQNCNYTSCWPNKDIYLNAHLLCNKFQSFCFFKVRKHTFFQQNYSEGKIIKKIKNSMTCLNINYDQYVNIQLWLHYKQQWLYQQSWQYLSHMQTTLRSCREHCTKILFKKHNMLHKYWPYIWSHLNILSCCLVAAWRKVYHFKSNHKKHFLVGLSLRCTYITNFFFYFFTLK